MSRHQQLAGTTETTEDLGFRKLNIPPNSGSCKSIFQIIQQNEMLKRSQAIHQHNPILLPILIYTCSYCYIWCHEFHLRKISKESKIHMKVATLSMCVTTLQQLTKSLSGLYASSLHAILQRPSESSLQCVATLTSTRQRIQNVFCLTTSI